MRSRLTSYAAERERLGPLPYVLQPGHAPRRGRFLRIAAEGLAVIGFIVLAVALMACLSGMGA